MYLSLVAVKGRASNAADACLVQDTLWAHATSRYGLEHILARESADGVDAVLFLRAGTAAGALAQAVGLLSVASAAGVLSHYSATLHPVE
ncbi:hypothetical protein ACFV6F_20705 [Kitasatospora phosalacinea]|uniref:hypothetical protein n=1 Tax=Kitasatospora phosalacinea TaxID=2065 RepID=UPI0036493BB2